MIGCKIKSLKRSDAIQDTNRKGTYLLNNAFIKEYPNNGSYDYSAFSWAINYTNGRKHTLCAALPSKKKSNDLTSGHTSNDSRNGSNNQRIQISPYERKKVKYFHR